MTDDRIDHSRRAVLTTLAATGATALAGCGGDTDATPTSGADGPDSDDPGSDDDSSGNDGPGGPPGAGQVSGAIGRWLPAPGSVVPPGDYVAAGLDLRTYASQGRSPPRRVRSAIERVWPPLSIDWQSVDLLVTVGQNHVLRTDVDPNAVVEDVTSQSGWALVEDSETAYPLLARADGGKAIAVAPSAVVVARGYGSDRPATATATGIVGAERGDVPRYASEAGALEAFLGAVPQGYRVHWRPAARFDAVGGPEPTLDGVAGVGWAARYGDGPAPTLQYYVVFDGPGSVDVDGVGAFVDANADAGQPFGRMAERTIRQSGPLVVVEGVAGEG